MKNFHAVSKSHASADEKHDINFHWPYYTTDRNSRTQERVEDRLLVFHWRVTSKNKHNFIRNLLLGGGEGTLKCKFSFVS